MTLWPYGCEGHVVLNGETFYPVFRQPDPQKDAEIIALCRKHTDAQRICDALNAV